jgi:hypothetical protein
MIANTEPQRIGKLSLEKRGEPGTRLQASPGPRTTHSPRPKRQGVC